MRLPARFSLIAKATCATAASRTTAIGRVDSIYLERAIAALKGHGIAIDDEALAHLSPIDWEHVNLTGDYTWQATGRLRKGAFRPLRPCAASNE